jgi:hypothetical protein
MSADHGLSSEAARILSQFPGPVTLHPSLFKWIGLFLGGVLATAFSVWSIRFFAIRGEPMYVIGGVLLVLCFAPLVSLMGGALIRNSMYMTLDAAGFEFRDTWSRTRRLWKDVDRFTSMTLFVMNRIVAYDDATRKPGLWNSTDSLFIGRNSRLFDTYGLRTADFARLLTAWRERALGQSRRNETLAS